MHDAVLGDYELVRRVGTGGTAEVFEARRIGLEGVGARVALKCILQDLASDERFVQQFINEARLGSQLRHRNIVAVEDFNLRDGLLYMAMEFVDGVDLHSVVAHHSATGQKFPPALAVYIMCQVLSGLDFAHSSIDEEGRPRNVIHRDIKPANLLLTRDGTVKIADFGIAKSATNLYQTLAGGMVKGSMAYMSPEQLAGRPLSPASDLFAAGAVLYEMLTLRRLFNTAQPLELMNKIAGVAIAEELAELEVSHPKLHPILARALAAAPADRFRSAREFADALHPLLDDAYGPAHCAQAVEAVLEARAARAASPDRGMSLFNAGLRSPRGISSGSGAYCAVGALHDGQTRLLDREVISLARQTSEPGSEAEEDGLASGGRWLMHAAMMVILLVLAGLGVLSRFG